jgi:hypothetical protein
MTIGLPLDPDPCGCSSPVHEPPDWKRTWSPAEKVVELTLARVCQAVLELHPSLLSLPDDDDT